MSSLLPLLGAPRYAGWVLAMLKVFIAILAELRKSGSARWLDESRALQKHSAWARGSCRNAARPRRSNSATAARTPAGVVGKGHHVNV